jgi:hypothetical protein
VQGRYAEAAARGEIARTKDPKQGVMQDMPGVIAPEAVAVALDVKVILTPPCIFH